MRSSAVTYVSRPILLLISAPSGGGKTTVCQQLLATHPELTRVITCTTRQPRQGERDGVDYHFLRREVFEARVGAGEFLEHAQVYGNLYGTLKGEVIGGLKRGSDVLLSVDVQGAETLRGCAAADPVLGGALVSVFIAPASMGVLEERLKRRGLDSDEAIRRRLDVAREEIGKWRGFDYVIVSRTIPEDLRRMQMILETEKMRSRRVEGGIEERD